jgi:hypothetical protein
MESASTSSLVLPNGVAQLQVLLCIPSSLQDWCLAMYLPFLNIRSLVILLAVSVGTLSLGGCEEVGQIRLVHPIKLVGHEQMVH